MMDKKSNKKLLLHLTLLGIVLIFTPLLMAFSPSPVISFIPVPLFLDWVIQSIGHWVLDAIPTVIEIGNQIVGTFTPCGEIGRIIVDPNYQKNATYSGCYQCTTNGVIHKINHPAMVRNSLNEPWQFSNNIENICR